MRAVIKEGPEDTADERRESARIHDPAVCGKDSGTLRNAPPINFEALPQHDPKQRCPDITKTKRIPGWEPKVGLKEELRVTRLTSRSNSRRTPLSVCNCNSDSRV